MSSSSGSTGEIETNGEVQDKLKRLINASGLGIEADIVHDDSRQGSASAYINADRSQRRLRILSLVWLRRLTQSP